MFSWSEYLEANTEALIQESRHVRREIKEAVHMSRSVTNEMKSTVAATRETVRGSRRVLDNIPMPDGEKYTMEHPARYR